MTSGTGSSTDAGRAPIPAAPRRWSPWMLVVLLFGGMFVVLAGGLGVAIALRPANPVRPMRAVQELAMPDGTILALEQVTFGKRHHIEIQGDAPKTPWFFFETTRKYPIDESTWRDSFMLWFTRRNATTGEYLDFEWWSHSIAIDEHGSEYYDDNAGRDSYSGHGSSGMSGSRPFSPVGGGKQDLLVAHSALPIFRHSSKTFKLRVFDTNGTKVAEFDAPYTPTATFPVWTPETLPATKKDGDLEVTLKSVVARPNTYHVDRRAVQTTQLEPKMEIRRDGKPAPEWNNFSFDISDALGNQPGIWNCNLSPHESAWKLDVTVWRSVPDPKLPPASPPVFDPSEQWTLSGLPVPEANKAQLVSKSNTIQGTPLEVVAVGGGGKLSYTDTAPAGSGGSSSSSGGVGDKSYHIESRSDRGTRTTTVDCPLPHLMARITGLSHEYRLDLRVTDDQNRNVPFNMGHGNDPAIYFLEIPEGAQSLSATFTVHKGRKAEFLIAPVTAKPEAKK